MNVPFEIGELIFRQLRNELSGNDKQKLDAWLNENPANRKLFDQIIRDESILKKLKIYHGYDTKTAWQNILSKTNEAVIVRSINYRKVLKYAAAILIPLLIGGYFLLDSSLFEKDKSSPVAAEILPGTQKAVLTLSNGEKIALDNNGEEKVIEEKHARIIDVHNMLRYTSTESVDNMEPEIAYNVLQTPRGGEYKVILPDGTKVWLNAATKLKFPTAFTGKERKVEIEGEAYFEVTKDISKPFLVHTGEMEIMVLGTSFNVNSYPDEIDIITTLVEGKVNIHKLSMADKRSTSHILIPGEQAVYKKKGHTIETKQVDTEIYTAWKDGRFIFARESLESMMRKLERWYNFETVYVNQEIRDYHFSGTLDRYEDISGILEMISLTTNISFEIRENTVIASKKIKTNKPEDAATSSGQL